MCDSVRDVLEPGQRSNKAEQFFGIKGYTGLIISKGHQRHLQECRFGKESMAPVTVYPGGG